MGLLSTEVEVKLSSQYIKYYENLGYIIPRYYSESKKKYIVKSGTTIIVKVQDLPIGSHALLDLVCDGCGKRLTRSYYDYNRRNYNGNVYCFHCAHKVLNSGENNCNWNSELTNNERQKTRKYPEYINFVKSVLARDNYTCQCCGKTNSDDMEVHHLYAYFGFPEYRTDQTQAITLCKNCHKNFHNWHIEKFGHLNKGKCTRDDYEEWYGHILNDLSIYNGDVKFARMVYDYDTKITYNNVIDCANALNIGESSVYKCCNSISKIIYNYKNGVDNISLNCSVKGHHLFWLKEYNNLNSEEITYCINYKNNKRLHVCKKVICLTTGEIFEKIKDGAENYGLKSSSKIGENCKGLIKSAGKSLDGTSLTWMYYDDFLQLTKEEQDKILSDNMR